MLVPLLNNCCKVIICLLISLCVNLVFIQSKIFAQNNNKIDSLKLALDKTKTDSIKVKTLILLGEQLLKSKPEDGLYYLNQADQIAKVISYDPGRLKALIILGDYYEKNKTLDQAILKYNQARAIAEQRKDLRQVADLLFKVAFNHVQIEDIETSTFFYYKASQIYKQLDDKNGQYKSIQPIAELFYNLEKYQRALNYFSEMLHISREMDDSTHLAKALNWVGATFTRLRNAKRANEFLDEAINIADLQNDDHLKAIIYISYGEMYILSRDFNKAQEYTLKALSTGKKQDDTRLISDAYNNLAGINYAIKNYYAAIDYQKLAIDYLKKPLDTRKITNYYQTISEFYTKIPDFNKAYSYHREYSRLQDSLFNQKALEAIYNLDIKYQSERKELEILELKNQRKISEEKLLQRRIINYSLGLGLMLILVFAFFLLRSNQRFRRTNELLKDRNRQIKAQTEEISSQKSSLERINEELAEKNEKLVVLDQEKTHLMGVVAHDLRSPINQVRGVLEIIKLTTDGTNEEQMQHVNIAINSLLRLDKMINRILDVNALEQSEGQLDFNKYDLADILEPILESSEQSASTKKIDFVKDIPHNLYYANLDENYAAQIFENLISNAVKFSPFNTKVFIKLTNQQDTVKVIIQDEGPGFAKEDLKKIFGKFQKLSAKPTAGEPSTGLGLSIVKKYVDLMEGDLLLESEPGKGAKFTIMFKKA